jgi:3-oxoadipate enol-lactonase/4-carboxymuconolactone decarboxylase
MTTLVLGPSLGTSATACWGPTIALLGDFLDVVAWELPGHGQGPGPVPADLTVSDLADRVLEVVDGPFVYAGDSIGGEVGLQLLLDAPDKVLGAVLCCTGARIGDEEMWDTRIAQVQASGTASLVTASAERWFGEGFLEREPTRASALLHAIRDATDDGYVAACRALRSFDVRHRLGDIAAPVTAVAGAQDPTCPPGVLEQIADGVVHGRLVVLDGVAHQAPAEAPETVAHIITELAQEVAA